MPEPLLHDPNTNWLVTEWVEGTPGDHADAPMIEQMVAFLKSLHSLGLTQFDEATLKKLDLLEDPLTALPAYLPETEDGRLLGAAIADGRIAGTTNRSVLVHGDYWPGNILWVDGNLAAVIDWEDAAIEDPLADVACAKVELLCQYDAATMNQFTERYLAGSDIDTTSLSLWEACVSASALATMLSGPSPTTRSGSEESGRTDSSTTPCTSW